MVQSQCESGGRCYDAIVADVNYHTQGEEPRLSGITAIDAVHKKFPNIPVIYVTAYDTSLVRQQFRRQGADWITKPFDYRKLAERVDSAVMYASQSWTGPDRRTSSVKFTGEERRASEQKLEVPKAVEAALTLAKAQAKK
jgi:DNA-binding response OmpR family regulator